VNTKMRRRMVVVTGVIVIVIIVVAAVVGAGTAARVVTVAEAAEAAAQITSSAGDAMAGKKLQVTGKVVADSYQLTGDTLEFSLAAETADAGGDDSSQLRVRYVGGVAATFGNGVTAICTGILGADGVLECSELMTKCPSKYENATDALGVEQLYGYGDSIVGNPVKVAGVVQDGTLVSAAEADGGRPRFTLADAAGSGGGEAAQDMPVLFAGALPDGVAEGASVVLTGALDEDGSFSATDVALAG